MSDFRYHLDRKLSLEKRFWRSEGIEFADHSRASFVYNSAIPRQPFVENPLSCESDSAYSPYLNPNDRNFLGVVDLKDFLSHIFFEQLCCVRNSYDVSKLKAKIDLTQICADVFEQARDLVFHEGDYDIRDVCLKEPGLITTTVNANGIHIGLHLDSFDMGSIYERASCRNRICINLGQEDRNFLFLNVSVSEMIKKLHKSGHQAVHPSIGSGIGGLYLRAFPNQHVNLVKIRPREAYIMPTENLLHDASTLGKQTLDVSLTVLGRFAINPRHLITRSELREVNC